MAHSRRHSNFLLEFIAGEEGEDFGAAVGIHFGGSLDVGFEGGIGEGGKQCLTLTQVVFVINVHLDKNVVLEGELIIVADELFLASVHDLVNGAGKTGGRVIGQIDLVLLRPGLELSEKLLVLCAHVIKERPEGSLDRAERRTDPQGKLDLVIVRVSEVGEDAAKLGRGVTWLGGGMLAAQQSEQSEHGDNESMHDANLHRDDNNMEIALRGSARLRTPESLIERMGGSRKMR